MSSEHSERFVKPEVVSSHFHIRPGEVVADFGAGVGYFIPVLAESTGRTGVVYACDIQKNLVETVAGLARSKQYNWVKPVWGDLESVGGTKIPDRIVEVGILVNTLFQIEDKQTGVAEIIRVMRPGARLYIIDWTESFGGLGPQPQSVFTEREARALFEAAGCTYERNFPAGPHHYGIMFRIP